MNSRLCSGRGSVRSSIVTPGLHDEVEHAPRLLYTEKLRHRIESRNHPFIRENGYGDAEAPKRKVPLVAVSPVN